MKMVKGKVLSSSKAITFILVASHQFGRPSGWRGGGSEQQIESIIPIWSRCAHLFLVIVIDRIGFARLPTR